MAFRGVDNRRILPYTRRITSSGGKVVLEFLRGSFTNATTRHLMIKNPGTGLWEMDGPFTGGTLATRVVGDKRYGQFHSAKSTVNTYSEAFRAAVSDWSNEDVNVTDDAATSPLGGTADNVAEDSGTSTHRIRQSCTFDGSSRYFFGIFMAPAGRTKCLLSPPAGPLVGDPFCYYDFSTVLPYSPNAADYYGMLPFTGGWYYIYIAATSDAAAAGYTDLYLANDAGGINYLGDGSSGFNVWGANFIAANMLSPYIYVGAVTGDIDKDQFAWSEATVNAHRWIRDGFKCTLSMSHATDEMLAADGGEHVIAAYDTTGAKGVVELYFDGADKKIKLRDDDNGALLESAALDWSLGDQIHCELTLDDGSNSKLVVDGGGVDTSYTGTQTAAADGPLHYGMDDSQALQFDLGQISEPEPL